MKKTQIEKFEIEIKEFGRKIFQSKGQPKKVYSDTKHFMFSKGLINDRKQKSRRI